MCGFAGLAQSSGLNASRDILAAMTATLVHRGPDDSGLEFPSREVGFGFRRLSIIDLSANGHQPMRSRDGNLTLCFNGEVYNAPELAAEHLSDYPFKSKTDTEVVLALFERYGSESVRWLNGMFAIAVWNLRERQLILARDRMGIKPLYYATKSQGLVFGSEIKALFQDPEIAKKIDPTAVQEYLTFQFTLGDKTVFSGVRSVEPATFMTFTQGRWSQPEVSRYWTYDPKPDASVSLDEHARRLRETLVNAIQRQTRSDVAVGSFLSSGMDTGAISTLARKFIPDLRTFTCGFQAPGAGGIERFNDERQDARALAAVLGTDHHEITLGPSSIRALMDASIHHLEDPKVGVSYQILAMAAEVKKYVTVVLSGTGGDELFGGYHWRYSQILESRNHVEFVDQYFGIWARILSSSQLKSYLHPDRLSELDLDAPRRAFVAEMTPTQEMEPLSKALYFDTRNFMQGVLLVDDKLNMAHSVEARVPLLDNQMIDLALQIPGIQKFDGMQSKIVLRKALEGVLPTDVLTRRKQGFTPPDSYWFRHENQNWICDRLLQPQFLDRRWITREGVLSILEQNKEGNEQVRFTIWSLLCLEGIYRKFID